jgi:hypothetical protein|tara:strand:+ start:5771 stop:5959 length:189 start_codon:yes stop_codon:yes gene_type:complete
MSGEDKLEVTFDGDKGVENGDGGTSGISENVFNPQIVESFDESLCSVELLCAHEKIAVSSAK